jgi:hypothetical protein
MKRHGIAVVVLCIGAMPSWTQSPASPITQDFAFPIGAKEVLAAVDGTWKVQLTDAALFNCTFRKLLITSSPEEIA